MNPPRPQNKSAETGKTVERDVFASHPLLPPCEDDGEPVETQRGEERRGASLFVVEAPPGFSEKAPSSRTRLRRRHQSSPRPRRRGWVPTWPGSEPGDPRPTLRGREDTACGVCRRRDPGPWLPAPGSEVPLPGVRWRESRKPGSLAPHR